MAAPPPKADVREPTERVRFVPIADIRLTTPIPRAGGTRRKVRQKGSWQRFVREQFSIGRLSDALDRNDEHISDATLGLDDARRAGVVFKLASEAKNLHVDAAIEDIPMHARGLQQVLTAKWALRCIEKGKQQCVLPLGQGYRSAGWVGELPGLPVELPAGKSKTTALGFARRSGASFLEPA